MNCIYCCIEEYRSRMIDGFFNRITRKYYRQLFMMTMKKIRRYAFRSRNYNTMLNNCCDVHYKIMELLLEVIRKEIRDKNRERIEVLIELNKQRSPLLQKLREQCREINKNRSYFKSGDVDVVNIENEVLTQFQQDINRLRILNFNINKINRLRRQKC